MKKINYRKFKEIELKYKKQVLDLALTESSKLIVDFLKEFDHILLRYGDEIIMVKKGASELNELHYTFYATSKKKLEKLVDEAIILSQTAKAEGFKTYFEVVIPRFNSIPKLSEPLKLMFGGGFSDDIRKIIESQRIKEGFDLSKSLWKYTKDSQKQIWSTIYDGLQNNKTLSQIKKDISQFLTAEGKQNLSYNVKRLYVTEVNNAYLKGAEYVTKTTDFVKEVHIFRSSNGDPNCEICNELAGPVGGVGVIVDKNIAELPLYHPSCHCDYVDVLPTADDFIDYLHGG